METQETIKKRASLKTRLSGRKVEKEKIKKVLDAGKLAPSARNKQPWKFIVVEDKNLIEMLVTKAFSESNQPAKEAPVIIVACANPADDVVMDGKEYYLFDVATAMENMLLMATDLGLVTNPMAGVNESELKKILGVPPEVRFVALTPLAYPAASCYDEACQERLAQRTRKELQEVVYADMWGKPF